MLCLRAFSAQINFAQVGHLCGSRHRNRTVSTAQRGLHLGEEFSGRREWRQVAAMTRRRRRPSGPAASEAAEDTLATRDADEYAPSSAPSETDDRGVSVITWSAQELAELSEVSPRGDNRVTHLETGSAEERAVEEAAQAAHSAGNSSGDEERRVAERLLAAQKDIEDAAKHAAEQAHIPAVVDPVVAEDEPAEQKLSEIELQRMAEEKEKKLQALNAMRREVKLKKLVAANEYINSLMFYYPEEAVAGEEVEVFFHRARSALAGRSKIVLMGGYNDWQWKNFKAEMKPSADLRGDWWTCKLELAPEAHILNFVFFDDENLYENNADNDFFLRVERGMDEDTFLTFLNDQKRMEAEKAAAEKAEADRRAEELRVEAEKRAQREAILAQAKREAEARRNAAAVSFQQAATSSQCIWYTEPVTLKAGELAAFHYNRANRPLGGSGAVHVHVGYNDWFEKVTLTAELSFDRAEYGDWWKGEFTVPENAYMLNFVLADGPPLAAGKYDNNGNKDFHALVEGGPTQDEFWGGAEAAILKKLEEEQREKDEAVRKLAERRAVARAAMKAKTKEAFLQSQAHVIYTEPMDVQAGEDVTVFYNPNNGPLHGRLEVWIRGSFNRWTHRIGCWLPVKMVPAENGTHLKATMTVPLDAYVMDFVFSERGDAEGGIYDNRRGLDYHVPIIGTVKEPPMNIVHIALEMAPIAKVGGLGDVVTSLSRAVQELGHHSEVVLPKYDVLKYNEIRNLEEREPFFWGGTRIKTWFGLVEGVPVHFLEPENGMFWTGCIYGRKDDAARFGFFCGAALEFLLQTGRSPDIIHCHDWSSAPVSWLFQENYKHYGLANARIIFTIHNLEFGAAQIGKAMANAHMATTVSPTYAYEIGGHGAIAPHHSKFHGIRNGIDQDIWDPLGDPFLPMAYSASEVTVGKQKAKEELRRRLGLATVDRPIVGIITRLTAQKGIHLIKHAIWRTLERGGQVVLLGSAPDSRIQADFQNLSNQLRNSHNNMANLYLSYDEPLSHLIYAGSDMILVPSMFEPCGLTQMVAMRYGAVPVVRKTGGLNDTVFDVDHDRDRAAAQGLEPNGFSFEGTDAGALDYALNRAISTWYEAKGFWTTLSQRVMEQDWSWNRPALDYMELYHGARKLP